MTYKNAMEKYGKIAFPDYDEYEWSKKWMEEAKRRMKKGKK